MIKCAYRDRYLLYADTYMASENDTTPLSHISEAHELLFCAEGSLTANIEGVMYTISPGEILFYRDAEVHMITPKTFPVHFHHIKFSPYYFRLFDTQNQICAPFEHRLIGSGNRVLASDINLSLIQNCFSCIASIQDTYMRRIAVFGALTMILSEINRAYDPTKTTAEDARSTLLREIIYYVNSHLEEDLTPEHIAATLYISRSQMDRIFKQSFGFTLWKYITFKRLIKARHLLHAGIANNEVARQCGFGDYSTFYKVYTKIYSRPPKAAQPTEEVDPLLRQFYQFDETCSNMENPGEIEAMAKHLSKFLL